jgi:hypothetical protein
MSHRLDLLSLLSSTIKWTQAGRSVILEAPEPRCNVVQEYKMVPVIGVTQMQDLLLSTLRQGVANMSRKHQASTKVVKTGNSQASTFF